MSNMYVYSYFAQALSISILMFGFLYSIFRIVKEAIIKQNNISDVKFSENESADL